MQAIPSEIPLLVSFLVSSSVMAFWLGLQRRGESRALLDRLGQVGERQRVPEELEMQQPFVARVIKPALRQWVRRLGYLMPNRNVERLQHDLERAGRPYGLTISDFLGLRVIAALAISIIVAALLYIRDRSIISVIFLGLLGGFGGSFVPSFWLRRQIKVRQDQIRRGLPDALDMLSVAVTAGLALDGAMHSIAQKWDSAVAQEFGLAVREMQVGVPRIEALRGIARRTDVKEMSNFIAVLVQADQLGLSISTVLKTQSDQMRLLRRQRAEELANQAPIKMLFPLVFLIFPSMFAVILGPAVPRLIELFSYF